MADGYGSRCYPSEATAARRVPGAGTFRKIRCLRAAPPRCKDTIAHDTSKAWSRPDGGTPRRSGRGPSPCAGARLNASLILVEGCPCGEDSPAQHVAVRLVRRARADRGG